MVFPLRVDPWRATVHAEAKPNLKRFEISTRPEQHPAFARTRLEVPGGWPAPGFRLNSETDVSVAPAWPAGAASEDSLGVSEPDSSQRTRNGLVVRSEEHTSELQSRVDLVCRLLLEKKTSTTRNRR